MTVVSYADPSWFAILTSVFGGCCSNALALELLVRDWPTSGTFTTFVQFLTITLINLPHHLTWQPAPQTVPRLQLLHLLATDVLSWKNQHPQTVTRVAIDGIDVTGRISLANELAAYLRSSPIGNRRAIQVIRASTDSFQYPTPARYVKDDDSPEDSWSNSYDYAAVKRHLLKPLDLGGSREYVTEICDVDKGLPVLHPTPHLADADAILIVDGMFLHRQELADYWEYSVFLDPPLDVSSSKTSERDGGSNSNPAVKRNNRYADEQKLYVDERKRRARTSVVVNNVNLEHSTLQRRPPRHRSIWKYLLNIRVKSRVIPIRRWLIQVLLFLATSLLNSEAFRYNIPMGVHIIFRSGGVMTNMLVGWLAGKKYTRYQVFSILLVTGGVMSTTLSVDMTTTQFHRTGGSLGGYLTGICMLSLALLLSGVMGITQDRLYEEYGRGHAKEAVFYLHALSLPMFAFTWPAMTNDLSVALQNSSKAGGFDIIPPPFMYGGALLRVLPILLPVATTTLTQVVCITGVHKLTSRVDSLTVSIFLSIRKAISLYLSVFVFKGQKGNRLLWLGACMVFAGSLLYSAASKVRTTKALKAKSE